MKRFFLLVILSLVVSTTSRAQLTCPDYVLHHAVVEGYPEALNIAVGLYADTGLCDIDGKSPTGDTPLQLAVFLGKAKMVAILLNNGANPSIKNLHGNTAIEWAEVQGNEEIIFLLNQSLKKASKESLLSVFSEEELKRNNGIDIEKIKMLIDAGADVNAQDERGFTALHSALSFTGCLFNRNNPLSCPFVNRVWG